MHNQHHQNSGNLFNLASETLPDFSTPAIVQEWPVVHTTYSLRELSQEDAPALQHVAHPIGPRLYYNPKDNSVLNATTAATNPASSEDDRIALQQVEFEALCQGLCVLGCMSGQIEFSHRDDPHAAFWVRRSVVMDRYRLVVVRDHAHYGELFRKVLEPSVDLLSTLDQWGADISEAHDILTDFWQESWEDQIDPFSAVYDPRHDV